MNARARYAPVLNALLARLPGSAITNFQSRDWLSSTFEGQKITFRIQLAAGLAAIQTTKFCDEVSESKLPANGYFVADIAANAVAPNQIEIEMLVITE